MPDESYTQDAMPPQVEAALGQIEEWVAILAVEIGTAVTAKLLRRLALEIEDLPTAVVQ